MELERAGGGELAELVTDHRLGDVDGHVLATVVDGDGVADHVRDDRAPAGPRLDDPLLVSRVEIVDLLQQMVVDERSLFQAARHATPTSTSAHRGYGGDGRSASAIPCWCRGCGPRACPMATPDGVRRTSCLRRRRAGGRPGSWRHRGSA